jgi:hypothetical protein
MSIDASYWKDSPHWNMVKTATKSCVCSLRYSIDCAYKSVFSNGIPTCDYCYHFNNIRILFSYLYGTIDKCPDMAVLNVDNLYFTEYMTDPSTLFVYDKTIDDYIPKVNPFVLEIDFKEIRIVDESNTFVYNIDQYPDKFDTFNDIFVAMLYKYISLDKLQILANYALENVDNYCKKFIQSHIFPVLNTGLMVYLSTIPIKSYITYYNDDESLLNYIRNYRREIREGILFNHIELIKNKEILLEVDELPNPQQIYIFLTYNLEIEAIYYIILLNFVSCEISISKLLKNERTSKNIEDINIVLQNFSKAQDYFTEIQSCQEIFNQYKSENIDIIYAMYLNGFHINTLRCSIDKELRKKYLEYDENIFNQYTDILSKTTVTEITTKYKKCKVFSGLLQNKRTLDKDLKKMLKTNTKHKSTLKHEIDIFLEEDNPEIKKKRQEHEEYLKKLARQQEEERRIAKEVRIRHEKEAEQRRIESEKKEADRLKRAKEQSQAEDLKNIKLAKIELEKSIYRKMLRNAGISMPLNSSIQDLKEQLKRIGIKYV